MNDDAPASDDELGSPFARRTFQHARERAVAATVELLRQRAASS